LMAFTHSGGGCPSAKQAVRPHPPCCWRSSAGRRSPSCPPSRADPPLSPPPPPLSPTLARLRARAFRSSFEGAAPRRQTVWHRVWVLWIQRAPRIVMDPRPPSLSHRRWPRPPLIRPILLYHPFRPLPPLIGVVPKHSFCPHVAHSSHTHASPAHTGTHTFSPTVQKIIRLFFCHAR